MSLKQNIWSYLINTKTNTIVREHRVLQIKCLSPGKYALDSVNPALNFLFVALYLLTETKIKSFSNVLLE